MESYRLNNTPDLERQTMPCFSYVDPDFKNERKTIGMGKGTGGNGRVRLNLTSMCAGVLLKLSLKTMNTVITF